MEWISDWSYRGERFKTIDPPYKILRIHTRPLIKIRIASWRPKQDRSKQAVYYYDCRTEKEAEAAMLDAATKPLKEVRELFHKMYDEFITNNPTPNTGEGSDFSDKFITKAREIKTQDEK